MRRRERAVAGFFGSVALVVGQPEIRTASRQNFRVRQTEQPTGKFRKHGVSKTGGATDRKSLVKYVD